MRHTLVAGAFSGFLGAAIVLEVAGTTCMKLSEGMTKTLPSVLIFVLYGLSFWALTLALKPSKTLGRLVTSASILPVTATVLMPSLR